MRNLIGHLVPDHFVEEVKPAKMQKLVHVSGSVAFVPSKLLKIVSALDGMSAHLGPCPVAVSVGLSSRAIVLYSLHVKYAGIRAKAAQACTALLKRLKVAPSLYAPLCGPNGSVVPA